MNYHLNFLIIFSLLLTIWGCNNNMKAERIITVGGEGANIPGFTSQAVQEAIDLVNRSGGGTVKLLPGDYEVNGPIRLYSNIHLDGSGAPTILKKSVGIRRELMIDPGYGEKHLVVSDASGFSPGVGVQVYDSANNINWAVSTAVITSVEGNDLYLDQYLERDYKAGGIVSNAFSLISAVNVENITISNLIVDGNREQNEALNGCRGGCIYLHKAANILVENVVVKNFDNDGISWQITENVTVRNCEVFGCANAGLHPGTGSPNTLIEGINSHDNGQYGIYVCWRVRNGVIRNSSFCHNGGYGICTGHMDTDMLFEGNRVSDNGIAGVYFRPETQANAPHRSIFRKNTVEGNGWKESAGYGFIIDSPAEDVVLEDNIIRNTEGKFQKAAIYISKNGLPVKLVNNMISGHAEGEIINESQSKQSNKP